MNIKRLTTEQEIFESQHLIDTAFLHPWDEDESRKRAAAEAKDVESHTQDRWALFDDAGSMVASIHTMRHRMAFGGQSVPFGEVHMVGSLPEGRGGGNVRALMAEVLQDFKARGDVFAMLIPFSFAFYRKFGFELAARTLEQRVPIEQLVSMSCDFAVTRVSSEQDVAVIRGLYDAFASTRNLAELRGDAAWAYQGNGEWGERDFFHPDCLRYTYVLWDNAGTPHAYVTFIFVTEEKDPFVGELKVSDMVYDSPEAFRGILGFLYRMRAKVSHVRFDLMDDLDLATILPECEDVERTLGGHVMARLLDVGRALELMPHPQAAGSYVVGVKDDFMSENTGAYRVTFTPVGGAQVALTNDPVDMEVTEQTLCQLVVGRISLDDALYREGTTVRANGSVLRQVFVRRPVSLQL